MLMKIKTLMYNSGFENSLLAHDVIGIPGDFVSIQPDVDETKVKAAAKVAQDIDIKRVVGKGAIDRARTPQNEADEALRELMIPAWCYFTYSRLLLMFQGVLTDGGLTTEIDANSVDMAKSIANQHSSVAEVYLTEVINFLDAEKPQEVIDKTKLTPRIRVFGGNEFRS